MWNWEGGLHLSGCQLQACHGTMFHRTVSVLSADGFSERLWFCFFAMVLPEGSARESKRQTGSRLDCFPSKFSVRILEYRVHVLKLGCLISVWFGLNSHPVQRPLPVFDWNLQPSFVVCCCILLVENPNREHYHQLLLESCRHMLFIHHRSSNPPDHLLAIEAMFRWPMVAIWSAHTITWLLCKLYIHVMHVWCVCVCACTWVLTYYACTHKSANRAVLRGHRCKHICAYLFFI